MTNPSRPLVIAHRGASGYRPEHTRAAYELAFTLGADAVEPDIVACKDGVQVLRHENEISGTTDVAAHPEFAHLRTTKVIDGQSLTGWFTEDLTWDELSTLRARERLPEVRTGSATFDDRWGILRLADLLSIIDEQSGRLGRELIMVAEIKHATHFASAGLPLHELFAARSLGRRSRARSVRSSPQVKSSVNQPVSSVPSITFVVRRPSNSGCRATSVVPEISFSCRSTSTPSRVATMSGSTASAPRAKASRYAASVCSGRYPLAPR